MLWFVWLLSCVCMVRRVRAHFMLLMYGVLRRNGMCVYVCMFCVYARRIY